MRVLLLSTYELGHQPLGLARPAADLTAAGHEVRCLDLAVDRLDEALIGWAELIGISVPMHTATRLGARLAERVRTLNPTAHITFYGLYASLHADVLIGKLGDSAIGGEFEGPLVALADALEPLTPGSELEGSTAALADALEPLTPRPPLPCAGEGESTHISHGTRSAKENVTIGLPLSRARERGAGGEGAPVIPGVRTATHDGGVFLGRQAFRLPRRDLL